MIFAGGVIGFALGGLIDVIVIHHVLQWHHLISNVVDPNSLSGLRTNILADGLLSTTMLLVLLSGISLLFRVGNRADAAWSASTLSGSLLVGWAIFNILDSVVNHHLLGLHHVNPGPNQLLWEVVFTVFSLLLIVIGVLLVRRGTRSTR